MKKILLFLIFFSFVALLQAQSKEEQSVQQTVIHAFDALSRKDSIRLRNECTTDVKFYEYGETWTIDYLINLAITTNTDLDFKRANKIDFVNTSISNNVAWVTYNLYSEITTTGKTVAIHWMETQVLVKEKGKWKIKLLHSTQVKRS